MLVVLSAKMDFTFFLNVQLMNTSEILYLFLILQIDIDIILHGSENLTETQNVDMFSAVQTFIRNNHRFD